MGWWFPQVSWSRQLPDLCSDAPAQAGRTRVKSLYSVTKTRNKTTTTTKEKGSWTHRWLLCLQGTRTWPPSDWGGGWSSLQGVPAVPLASCLGAALAGSRRACKRVLQGPQATAPGLEPMR